jgi:hypothetical protein
MKTNKSYPLSPNAKILITILLMATIATLYSLLRTDVNSGSATAEYQDHDAHKSNLSTKSEKRKQRTSYSKNPELKRAERRAALEREFIVLEELLAVE